MLKCAIQTQFIGLVTIANCYTKLGEKSLKKGPFYMRNEPILMLSLNVIGGLQTRRNPVGLRIYRVQFLYITEINPYSPQPSSPRRRGIVEVNL